MLDYLRKNASSWFVWVLLGGICLVFIFFFGYSHVAPGVRGQGTIAVVNGEPIAGGEFRLAYDNTENYYKQIFQGAIPEQFQDTIYNSALQQLIGQRLQADAAHAMGLRTTDIALAAAIRQMPSFADEEGNFSAERYAQYRDYYQQKYRVDFESMLRTEIVANAANGLVSGANDPISEAAIRAAYDREHTTFTFDVVRIRNDQENAGALAEELRTVFVNKTQRDTWLTKHEYSLEQAGPFNLARRFSLLGTELSESETRAVLGMKIGEVCPANLVVNNDYIVCQLRERKIPNDTDWDEAKENYTAQLIARNNNSRTQAWLDELFAEANVIRYEQSSGTP